MDIRTRDDAAQAAADYIIAQLRKAIAERGRATLALSGGSTPLPMFAAMARAELRWHAVDVLQVDERIAPRGDAARNAVSLLEALVEPARIPKQSIHLMPVERDDLGDAAAEYAGLVEQLAGRPPQIDVIHLGLGADGHTASLVPGDGALEADAPVAITGEYMGHRRMTLTFAVLNRARRLVWLVSGADKARALEQLRRADAAIPAGRVRATRAVVFADTDAVPAPTARPRR